MTESDPLAGLPSAGVFPIQFTSAFRAAAKGVQPRGKEALGLKYKFKPASVTPSSKGELKIDKGQPKLIHFDGQNGTHQTFDVHEESVKGKGRECVLIWNQELASFTITPLITTMNLHLNRDLSAKPRAQVHKAEPATKRKSDSGPGPAPEATRTKKSRPSQLPLHPPPAAARAPAPAPAPAPASVPARPTKGGKGLPRKSIPTPTPIVAPPTKTSKGGNGIGKYKSSEIIDESDDSDNDDDDDDHDNEDQDMEPVDLKPAPAPHQTNVQEDEDDEDDENDEMRAMLAEELAEPMEPAVVDSSEEEESSDDDLC